MDKVGHKTLETMSFAKWYNKWLFSLMRRYLGKEILEAGAGIGNFTELMAKAGHVTATDIEKDYIDLLTKRLRNKATVGFGDIEKDKYFFKNSENKFDSVVCLNVLEHIRNDEITLINLSHLLKKGGFLILLVPAHHFLFSEFDTQIGHFRRYSRDEVEKKLAKAGFNPRKVV